MDAFDMVAAAAAMVPPTVVAESGCTVADVREYIDHNEYGVALGVLAELNDGWPVTVAWWDLLIRAAGLMNLPEDAERCRWGRRELTNGLIRARLSLTTADPAVPGGGLRDHVWDVGREVPCLARVRVEYASALAPGGTGTLRLTPSDPREWRHLRPGDLIGTPDGPATGEILEVRLPARSFTPAG